MVLTVSWLLKVGSPEDGLKEQVTPVGRVPVQARVTDWVAPPSKFAIIVLVPEEPWVTVMPPELLRAKSKGARA